MNNKYFFSLFIVCFLFMLRNAHAQVLYFEDFEKFSLGNVGTDITGDIPGQGGFLTKITTSIVGSTNGSNSDFRIQVDPKRGNILAINSQAMQQRTKKEYMIREVIKPDLDYLWNTRDTLNNIMMYEYFFYTEKDIYVNNWQVESLAQAVDSCVLSNIDFNGFSKKIFGSTLLLPSNTWVNVITYVDYYTNKIYHQIPSSNYGETANYNLVVYPIEEHKISRLSFLLKGYDVYKDSYSAKYDDIKISAIYNLPKFLSFNIVNISKFNIYPNPVNDILTISNPENISVDEIIIYDLTGKNVKKADFHNGNEMQVDVSNFKAGVYSVHVNTKQGTEVKKIIKK